MRIVGIRRGICHTSCRRRTCKNSAFQCSWSHDKKLPLFDGGQAWEAWRPRTSRSLLTSTMDIGTIQRSDTTHRTSSFVCFLAAFHVLCTDLGSDANVRGSRLLASTAPAKWMSENLSDRARVQNKYFELTTLHSVDRVIVVPILNVQS